MMNTNFRSAAAYSGICALLTLVGGHARAMDDTYALASTCEWPTTVYLEIEFDVETSEILGFDHTVCTGAYVGDGVIVSAGHCLKGAVSVTAHFGEDGLSPEETFDDVDCLHHPGGEWILADAGPFNDPEYEYRGPDIAFCVIDVEHPSPPKIPIMVPNGCETDYIREQLFGDGWAPTPATYVGMGQNEIVCAPNCVNGKKRYASGDVMYQSYSTYSQTQTITALQPDPDYDTGINAVVPGDSGGPMNFEMHNETHRIIANISKRGNLYLFHPDHPTEQEHYKAVELTPTPLYLRWIEFSSGRDVSPCHTWDNTSKSWTFTGGSGCGLGYDASAVGGPSANWSSTSSGVTACSATDVLSSETACAGWSPWPTIPPWVTAHPPKSNGDGLVDLAVNGSISVMSLFEARGLGELYGSTSNDVINGTSIAEEFFLGEGNDSVPRAGDGDDQIHAGSGDDEVYGGDGADIIHGSYGLDKIYGENGDDTIVILGECEIEPGEIYDGGSGTDTLISPLTVMQLQGLGVTVLNFETVVTTHANAQAGACDVDPNMTEVWGDRSTNNSGSSR